MEGLYCAEGDVLLACRIIQNSRRARYSSEEGQQETGRRQLNSAGSTAYNSATEAGLRLIACCALFDPNDGYPGGLCWPTF